MGRLVLTPGAGVVPDDVARDAALEEYHEIVAALAEANADSRAWWYSWLSCRDIYNISLCERLAVVAAAEGCDGSLACDDGDVADEILRRARKSGRAVEIGRAARISWLTRRIRERIGSWRSLLAEARWQLRSLHEARRSRRDLAGVAEADVVLVTMLHEGAPGLERAPYVDSYFGDLPSKLGIAKQRAIIFGQPVGSPRDLATAAARVRDFPVLTLFAFARRRDIGFAFAAAAWSRLRFPRSGNLASSAILRLVRRDHDRVRNYIARAIVLERALRRLLAAAPKARVIHMCENNQWERACVLAARGSVPPRRVDGYMHNPIFPDNPKLRSSIAEWRTRPDPDRVITTGEGAREALLSLGTYPPERVVAGCALRLGESGAAVRASAGKIGTVLVLLSGLPGMASMLNWLDEAAREIPRVRILLRGHPNRPVDDLARRAGVEVGPGQRLEKSAASTLEGALEEADAVIYASSAAAFVAAWRGLPLLHFQGPTAVDADPFFMRPALRHVLRVPRDLAVAIAAIEAMPMEERKRRGEALAAYARSCMTPMDSTSLQPFLKAATPA